MIIEFLIIWAAITVLIIAAFFVDRVMERKLSRMLRKLRKRKETTEKPKASKGHRALLVRVIHGGNAK